MSNEVNFSDSLMTMLGIEKDRVEAALSKVDMDQLSFLVDAVANQDKETVNQIMKPLLAAPAKSEEAKRPASKKPEAKDDTPSKQKPKLRKAGNISVGDTVEVDGNESTVKQISAHGDTVGVMIDGELKMVNKDKVKKIKENADLDRMLTLAGLPPKVIEEEDEVIDGSIDELDYNEADPMADVAMDDMVDPIEQEVVHGEIAHDAPEPAIMAPVPAPEAPAFDNEYSSTIAAPMPALGGIEAAIAQVEAEIPNCKLSEYRALVARLEGLLATAKNQGRAALAEHRAIRNEMRQSLQESIFDDDDDLLGFGDDEDDFDFDLDSLSKQARRSKDEDMFEGAFDDEEDFLMEPTDEDDIDLDAEIDGLRQHHRAGGRFEEGKLHTKEDALDVDGDNKPEEKGDSRKTLLDYVNETEENMTIGGNHNDALKNIQARMGPKASPQDARRTFDAMKNAKVVKQNGSKFEMPAMSDDEFNSLISGDDSQNGNSNQNNSGQQKSHNGYQNSGSGNGYQGQ